MKKQFAFLVLFSVLLFTIPNSQKADALPACTASDWLCADWGACHADGNYFQNRTCSKTTNCEGGVASPATQQVCTPPFCTSYTYSDWSSCDPNLGNQERINISNFPSSCIIDFSGNNPAPITRQRCTPECTSSSWSCGNWNACSSSSSQTRTCTGVANCQGGVSSPPTSQSCTYTAPLCTSFNYSSWSSCSTGGNQTRNIISSSPSSCTGGNPVLSQSCTPPQQPKTVIPVVPPPVYQVPQPSCTDDTWTCGNWNACSLSGVQNRSCKKTFDCPGVETAPPTTDQYCEAPNRSTQQVPQNSGEIANQDAIIKATVKLLCPFDEKFERGMGGSGTIIDQSGTILTNKHVIDGTLGCLVGFINSADDTPYFGDRQIADIQKTSSNEDVAILKLRNPQNRKLTYIDITKANSNLRLGTKVNIYGYPTIFGKNMTYTSGDYSGPDGSYLKTTAIIEHGNSGGGAYLNNGTFIGMPSAVVKGELNALGYILSINAINAWIGNSSLAYSNNNNNYSRVSSILENIDLKTLGLVQLVVPGTKEYKEVINPKTSVVTQPTNGNDKFLGNGSDGGRGSGGAGIATKLPAKQPVVSAPRSPQASPIVHEVEGTTEAIGTTSIVGTENEATTTPTYHRGLKRIVQDLWSWAIGLLGF